jgi:hypothetical protein
MLLTVRNYVGFEVLSAVVTKSTVFWVITPCSPMKVNLRFGGSYRLLLQDRRISRARNQPDSRWQVVGGISTDYTALYPRRWLTDRRNVMGWSVNRFVFLMGTPLVFCEDVAGFSNIMSVKLMLEMVTETVLQSVAPVRAELRDTASPRRGSES